MYTLSTDDLGKRFGRSWVFRQLSLSVCSGESLAVTGRNGSGKSTLLRMLSGLLRPTAGKVELKEGASLLEGQEHVRSIGYVAPTLNFYKKMSAFENLALVCKMRGMSKTQAALSGVLEDVGLDGRGADLVGGYSSGMLQRLRIASVLIHEPPVMLLDEPFSNLDPDGFRVVRSVLDGQVRDGGIVVLATNSSDEAALCASRVEIPELTQRL